MARARTAVSSLLDAVPDPQLTSETVVALAASTNLIKIAALKLVERSMRERGIVGLTRRRRRSLTKH